MPELRQLFPSCTDTLGKRERMWLAWEKREKKSQSLGRHLPFQGLATQIPLEVPYPLSEVLAFLVAELLPSSLSGGDATALITCHRHAWLSEHICLSRSANLCCLSLPFHLHHIQDITPYCLLSNIWLWDCSDARWVEGASTQEGEKGGGIALISQCLLDRSSLRFNSRFLWAIIMHKHHALYSTKKVLWGKIAWIWSKDEGSSAGGGRGVPGSLFSVSLLRSLFAEAWGLHPHLVQISAAPLISVERPCFVPAEDWSLNKPKNKARGG